MPLQYQPLLQASNLAFYTYTASGLYIGKIMRLAQFIIKNQSDIIAEWEAYAKTLSPAADNMSKLQLRDHIVEILAFITTDIESPQTAREQKQKSFGDNDTTPFTLETAAETHGSLRHKSGFNIVQMVSEYRALRSSIIRLWTDHKGVLADQDVLELTRFNEAIDQALAESVLRFMEKVDYSKDLLLGVLGHDIRSPLGAISMLSQMLAKVGSINDKQDKIIGQIRGCTTRVTGIVSDLLDLTRARMGSGLPVTKLKMDIGQLAKEIMNEIHIQHPSRKINLETTGDLTGEWDSKRFGQVFSNLISNAIQYGSDDTSIDLKIDGTQKPLLIAVQNYGTPIPATNLKMIFKSFSRGEHGLHSGSTGNLGLGLFITKEIVKSHNGKISVSSDEANGTIFTVTLPR